MQEQWLDALVKLFEKKLKLNTDMMKGSKRNKLLSYLMVLENARQKVMKSKDKELEKIYKDFFYDLYVIKDENIPYSVYETEQRLAREKGFGEIEITEKYKQEKNKEIINDQKASLDKWLDYFLWDDEAKQYEPWEVFWVLEGLQTLGKYDKESHTFSRRNKNTIYPFVEVNKIAVFNTLNLMHEYLKNKTAPEEIKAALGQSNFKQLYEYSLYQLTLDGPNIGSNDGIWIKYEKGSDYNVMRNSLQGYKTGWCIAAGESFARDYLAKGDFHIFYTKDENGEYKVPRIAIRMLENNIEEIRGIENDQNLEPEMLPILDQKLQEFPDRDKYYKKEHDMKILTIIDEKTQKGEELTKEEILFLYEVGYKINGFGLDRDPRIKEIQSKRDFKKDLSYALNCSPDEISNDENDVLNGKKIKCFYGSLDFGSLTSAKGLILPSNISGGLNLFSLTSAEGLTLPSNIAGNLDLSSLTSAEGLTLPNSVGGNIYLDSLTSAEGLTLPNSVGGNVYLNSLPSVEGIIFPNSIGGSLDLSSLKSAEGLTLPNSVGGDLKLRLLKSAEGLTLPSSIGGSLDLFSLTSAKGLTLPSSIGGDLNLFLLMSCEGIIFPNSIGGSLDLSSLTSAEGLTLPNSVGGNIHLDSLKSAEGLTLPNNVGGDMHLNLLKNAKDLILPSSIGKSLILLSLKSSEGLIIPEDFTCDKIYANDEVKNYILEKINNKGSI